MSDTPHGPGGPHVRAAAVILEALAAAVMSADAADEQAVSRLLALLDELSTIGHAVSATAAASAAGIRASAADVRGLAVALDEASEAVASMQEEVARGPVAPAAAPAAPAVPGAFVLPEWGDEKTLREFLAGQRGSL